MLARYVFAAYFALAASPAAAVEIEVTLDAGKHDRVNSIVAIPIELPETLADVTDAWPVGEVQIGLAGPGQVARRPLTSAAPAAKPGHVARMLYLGFVDMKAGEKKSVKYMIDLEKNVPLGIQGKPRSKFEAWKGTTGKHADLMRGNVPVLRYMYEALDTSSKERRAETFKPYHHLYTPDGKQLATKGPGGLFPHHRGLFYGFNKITYGKQQADTWHCNRGEWQSHNKVLASDVGHVLGRQRVAIDWHGRDGKVFANEERELTAFMIPTSTGGATLIEFASKLTATGETVHLDGDPQHAGFQFRASQEVPDKTAKQTYYIRPDGADKPGKFRNWPADKQHENLPWNALCFVLGDQRYTAVYADHPKNPHPARFSERDYGRFGCYFVHDVTAEAPLVVNYRLYLQAGELKVDHCARVSREFVEPIAATVK